jgi:hypothetical protein
MNVAVVILNYNSASDCRKCIGFLKKQEGVGAEIIVVDNCSPREGEQESIRSLCEELHCTFIQATENRGYNAGNNIGLRYAAKKGYKYALIANPDMEFPQKNYLMKMVEAMGLDSSIVACGTDILTVDGLHQNPMKPDLKGGLNSFGWLSSFGGSSKKDTYDFIDNYKENHYCYKISGCCLMVDVEFLNRLDFFDESVFLYCEESILSKQILRENKRMFYMADNTAIHRHVNSEKGNPRPRLREWRKSRLYYIKNYSGDNWWQKWADIASASMYTGLLIMVSLLKGR